jgi:glycerol-3-phosphate acyltransferase PlsX
LKIALDAVGGDLGAGPNVQAALRAAKELGCEIVLVGPTQAIGTELSNNGASPAQRGLELVPAGEAVPMDADPVRWCREKPDCSIMTAAKLVAEGRADALVSAGHSGATVTAALWHLKRMPGVLKPAIAAPLPTLKGVSVLLDAGANPDCKPWHLLQFGAMGALYAKQLLGAPEPSIGVLSSAEEDSRGSDLVRDSIVLLRTSGLRFVGPVDARDVFRGAADVLVCDGFVGNVALKTAEGLASALFGLLETDMRSDLRSKLGKRLLGPGFERVKKRLSDDEVGGAPLLGVGKTTVVAHGRSSAKALFNAIRVARDLASSDLDAKLKSELEKMKSNVELSRVLD